MILLSLKNRWNSLQIRMRSTHWRTVKLWNFWFQSSKADSKIPISARNLERTSNVGGADSSYCPTVIQPPKIVPFPSKRNNWWITAKLLASLWRKNHLHRIFNSVALDWSNCWGNQVMRSSVSASSYARESFFLRCKLGIKLCLYHQNRCCIAFKYHNV